MRPDDPDYAGEKPDKGERVLHGLGVSPGIAIGPAFVSNDGEVAVPDYRVADDQVEAERARFAAALAVALKQLRKLKGTVILAEELTPADTALMDPQHIAGFAAVLGGPESHTAIMARALGLPAVLGVAGVLGHIDPGDTVVVDGAAGTVVINPDGKTVAHYEEEREALEREERQLARLKRLPAVTRDEVEIVLQANLEL